MLLRAVLALSPLAAAGVVAGPAIAHVGHLGEVAGHSHWVAGAAIGLAGAIAIWAGSRARRKHLDPSTAKTADPGQRPEETSGT